MVSTDLAQVLVETTNRMLSDPQAALLNGILFGSQTKLPHDLTQALRVTGTLHVVAVSGQNMSILAGFIGKFSQALGWKVSLLVQGAGIIGYAFLVGGGASVVRSGVMALIALFAAATGRQTDAGRALIVTSVGMVLIHPDYLTDVGWQLSVLATAGIVWLEPILSRLLKAISEKIRPALSVSLSAQALTWPIILYNFGIFSLISVPVNVLVEWSVPWSMALGALAVLSAQVWFGLGQVIAFLAWVPLTFFLTVVSLGAKVPLSSFQYLGFPIGLMIIYYSLLGWWTSRWWQKRAA